MSNLTTDSRAISCRVFGKILLSFVLVFSVCSNAWADSWNELLEELPSYQASQLSSPATLHSVGSDSMGALVSLWVSQYRKQQESVVVQVQSRGSASAPAALIEGTADIGPMARQMKGDEVKNFMTKYGFQPTQIRTALAGVAVYVSADNPIKSLSLSQLDGIYCLSRSRGAETTYTNWGSLGVKGELSAADIMTVGTASSSYPYAYFRQKVGLQSQFNPSLLTTANTEAVFATIEANKTAIGFGSVLDEAQLPAGVKMLAVSKEGGKSWKPSLKNLTSGKYPLSRFLNVYTVRRPGEELEPVTKDFLRFVLSKEGQTLVLKYGLMPLPSSVVKEELGKLS